jgi:hypothetical protein
MISHRLFLDWALAKSSTGSITRQRFEQRAKTNRIVWIMVIRTLVSPLVLLLTSCDLTSSPVATPNMPGSVEITYPLDGAVIYADQLYAAGTASGLTENSFALQLVGTDGSILARYSVPARGGEWRAELAHGYSGEPIVVNVLAVPESADLTCPAHYDAVNIVLSSESYQPDGAFGVISSPVAGSTVTGDLLEVKGRVSGIIENAFLLMLIDSEGNALDSSPVTVFNPYFVVEVP